MLPMLSILTQARASVCITILEKLPCRVGAVSKKVTDFLRNPRCKQSSLGVPKSVLTNFSLLIHSLAR